MNFEVTSAIPAFEPEAWKKGRPKTEWQPIHHALNGLKPGETLLIRRDAAAMSCVALAVGQVARETPKKFTQRKILWQGKPTTAVQLRSDQ